MALAGLSRSQRQTRQKDRENQLFHDDSFVWICKEIISQKRFDV